ncbi:hypothetical protein [Saccharothrix sp.]|uniref:NACHT N-terminal helical domain 7-containing protein n=1 Tax=Saccharothrix sp. TaxID=1873460 RepID=UPI002810CAF4|nr:hypothetical protein [Saccharothrix sp.]
MRGLAKRFGYADAVRLLGVRQHKLVAALDRLVGGALLGGVAFGFAELLGWFDAKADFVRLAHELLSKAGSRIWPGWRNSNRRALRRAARSWSS